MNLNNSECRTFLREFLYEIDEDELRFEICDQIQPKIKRDKIKKIPEIREIVDNILNYYESIPHTLDELNSFIEEKYSVAYEAFLERKQLSISPCKASHSSRSGTRIGNYNQVDVLIITAAEGEQEALLKCKDKSDETDDLWEAKEDIYNLSYWKRSFTYADGTPFTVATAQALDMGMEATARTASRLAQQLKPTCLAMVGICAGRRGFVSLGDVLVANKVFSFKGGLLKAFYDGQLPHKQIYEDITTYNLNPVWLDRIRHHKQYLSDWTNTIALKKPKSYEYQKYCLLKRLSEYSNNASNDVKYCPLQEHLNNSPECEREQIEQVAKELLQEGLIENGLNITWTDEGLNQIQNLRFQKSIKESSTPELWICSIGTGNQVQEDERLFEYVEKLERKAYGVEMEGHAIGATAWELSIPKMIVVKAVSDYGDQHREKNRHFRQYACKASASFLIAFLKKYLFI